MKRIIVTILSVMLPCTILCTSCHSGNSELYKETDSFVQSLQTTYTSYGFLNSTDYAKTTKDRMYTITPIGRLINVKILKASSREDYEKLKKRLGKHYKDDKRVNDVYICKAGTVMIDCRN